MTSSGTPAPPAPSAVPATHAALRFRSGSGRLCLDFMRTLRLRGTDDAAEELDSPEALAAWVAQLGPYPARYAIPEPTGAELRAARELREAVHTLLVAARGKVGPAACPAHERALLNRTAAGPVARPILDATGAIRYESDSPVTATLTEIARDALELATSPGMARVRPCAGEHCAAWFLDTSRPGTRRWCSMDTCGNQAKKTTWRSKHTPGSGD